jgi:hypothetical protein
MKQHFLNFAFDENRKKNFLAWSWATRFMRHELLKNKLFESFQTKIAENIE